MIIKILLLHFYTLYFLCDKVNVQLFHFFSIPSIRLKMFYGRMYLTIKSARELPVPPGMEDSDLRPYLVIKVDDEERDRIGYKDNAQVCCSIGYIKCHFLHSHQDQEATNNPVWDREEVEVNVDEEHNESIKLVIYHNSRMEPHIIVSYVEISIGELSNWNNNTDDEVLTFNQPFTTTGTIQFEVTLEEDARGYSKRDAVPKIHTLFCHKFRVKAFPVNDKRSCAICHKMLWAGRGVECEYCAMVTHKQCCQFVLTKCRLNPIDIEPEKYNKKGRFELKQEHQFSKRTKVWDAGTHCSHCGDNFWWWFDSEKLKSYKCSSVPNCNTYVHEQCK